MLKLLIAVALTVMLSACGGGSTAPSQTKATTAFGSLSAYNEHATDLLESWNEPATVQAALQLKPGDISNVVTVPQIVAATGASPKDVQVLGVRNNSTHIHWRAGAAGHLDVDLHWDEFLDAPVHVRRAAERAVKVWSYRLRDNAELTAGGWDAHTDPAYNFESLDGADINVRMSESPQNRSFGGHRYTNPWTGKAQITPDVYDDPALLTYHLVHEFGHVLGHDFNQSNQQNGPNTPVSIARYVDWDNRTFNGPRTTAQNNGQPIPIQTDWGHFDGHHHAIVCDSVMSYCGGPRPDPTELDFAYLADIGYEVTEHHDTELYGYGAWAEHGYWAVTVERTLDHSRVPVRDQITLRAYYGGDPTPTAGLPRGSVTWHGTVLGVDLGHVDLPPVTGDAEIALDLDTHTGAVHFANLTAHAREQQTAFRQTALAYDVTLANGTFTDNAHVHGALYGPGAETVAGTLDDRRAEVNLMAGFGGTR